MAYDFPELTTMGALFRFAALLEQASIDVLEHAAGKSSDQAEALERMATKHRRRADELERARREKLNETVLEPLMDMPNTPYLPQLPRSFEDLDDQGLRQVALELEQRQVALYGDAVAKAGHVLAEVRRLFTRFERESTKNIKNLS